MIFAGLSDRRRGSFSPCFLVDVTNDRDCFVFLHETQPHGASSSENLMTQIRQHDVAIIGGGMAGLTAAIFAARAGHSVILLEKAPQPGGRATTFDDGGYLFNQGPHALYRSGDGAGILREIGARYSGAQASSDGSWALLGDRKFQLPRGAADFLASEMFSEEGREEAVALFGSLSSLAPRELSSLSLREWLDTTIRNAELRMHFEALVRLSTYANDPYGLSAGAALEQMITGAGGVDYLDGGWQTLVDSLRTLAWDAGVQIETRAGVEAIEARPGEVEIKAAGSSFIAKAVVITTNPETAARIVNGGSVASLQSWARQATPIYAACLDVALKRLPVPEHQFAISVDRPLYYSVHTRSAKLAPGNAAVVQLAKYLPTGNATPAREVEVELEALMDTLQPGWRSEVAAKRFLPRMLVANDLVNASRGGFAGRPGPAIPELPNVFVAGDWVGAHGMLADASLASARDAAALAVRSLGAASEAQPVSRRLAATV